MDKTIPSDYFKLLFFSIITCFIAYGFTLTNFSLSIDSEQTFYSDTSLSLGRWGTNLFRYHIFHGIVPYFTLLLGLLFFSLSAVQMARLFKLNTLQSYLFCGLMVTFPQMAYQFIFTMQADAIGFGFFLSALSITCFVKCASGPFNLRNASYFVLAALLYMFVIGIYQGLILIPAVIYLIIVFKSTYSEEYSFKTEFRRALVFAGFLVLTAVFYVISVKVLAPQADGGGYLSSYTSGSTDNLFVNFARLWATHLGGNAYYGEKTFLIASLIAMLLMVSFVFTRKKLLIRVVLLLVLLVVPFLFSFFITSGYNPPRIYVTSGIVFAFLIVHLMSLLPVNRIMMALGGLIIIVHVYFITMLFFAHYKVYNHDVNIARGIDNTIRATYPDFDPATEYVYFFGGLPYAEHDRFRLPDSEIFGGSFFLWDNGSNYRITGLFEFADVAHYKVIDKKEIYLGIKDSISEMPVWPKKGYVKKVNNVVIVKLGETKGAPLWIE